MQKFIAEQNIAHFRRLIAEESDKERLAMLRCLLAEEKAKLAALLTKVAAPLKAANESAGETHNQSQPGRLGY